MTFGGTASLYTIKTMWLALSSRLWGGANAPGAFCTESATGCLQPTARRVALIHFPATESKWEVDQKVAIQSPITSRGSFLT